LLFGYLGAVSAGFLLTAVPNWTGSLPLVGWPLAGLAALSLLGRGAGHLPVPFGRGDVVVLAVMTRASPSHAGQPLQATRGITALYVALIVAVLALHLAAGAWILAFGGFAVIYWPILARPRKAARQPNRARGADT